jgi:hypothetical protein
MRPFDQPKGTRSAKALIFGALASCLASGRAGAIELSAGLLGGGAYAWVSENVGTGSQGAGGGSFGFILEQRFAMPDLLLEVFEDFQPTPIQVQTGSASHTAGYLPVDVGARIGWGKSALQPYLGVIFQGLFLTGDPGGQPKLKQAAFGVGGATGLDLAIFFLRVGLELRLTETVTGLAPSGSVPDPGNVAVFQGLLSLRSAF